MEDIYSTRTAAMNFLHELCKARAKGNLDMLMAVGAGGGRGGVCLRRGAGTLLQPSARKRQERAAGSIRNGSLF
jgi:H+/gluconate symporter-like permease